MIKTIHNHEVPWSSVGYLTMKRTYSRLIDEGKSEEWSDIVNRVIKSSSDQLNVGFTEDEEIRLRYYLMSLKGTVAGRFLWQMGTRTVDDLGLASLQNCFSGDTTVLTNNGSKSLKDVVNTNFKVFAKGQWFDSTAKYFGKQELYQYTFSPTGRSSHTLQINATANHRWELEDGTITDSLKIGDKIVASGIELEDSREGFKHGLIFGDGSITYRYSNGDVSHSMRLCGKKENYKGLFDKYIYQPNCEGDPVVYERSSYSFKDYPSLDSTPEYISSFIKGWIAADGSTSASGSIVLGSTDENSVDFLTKNAPYAGYVVVGYSFDNQDTNFGKRNKPLCKIVLAKQKTFVVRSIDYIGEDDVYCAVVPGVERFTLSGGLLTCNCAFATIDTPVRPFTWAMDMLMLGSGVGYSLRKKDIERLPKVNEHFACPTRTDSANADFIVPDTREGWVKLLAKTLKAAFLSDNKATFTYSTQLLRGAGAPIKGFGGVASGPEILCDGIVNISKILEQRRGQKIKPIDALDIMNIIGSIVVAGNVRRSAQIAIGDYDDIEFLNAKRWDLGNIPSWRSMSNNSVYCHDTSLLPQEFWAGYEGKGEPYGLINIDLAKSCGRLNELQYPDNCEGFNPCAEQSLAPFETCCLAEIFLPNISSKEELFDLTCLLYRINKHSLKMPCHHEETQRIVWKNMRMGIGITGYLQATEEQKSWLSDNYKALREFDVTYSKKMNWPSSIKLTTIKPGGTLSLLPGVTPGCHPGYAKYMIRRIRIASNHPMLDTIRQHGYDVEYQRNFGTVDYSTVVVSFPFKYSDQTVVSSELSAIKHLDIVKRLQSEWSDNSVSCTIYYRQEELPLIKDYLAKNYTDSFKSLSFLLHSDHGFDQAPYEEITKEQYDDMVARTTLITSIDNFNIGLDDSECSNGVCPIR